MKKHLFQKSSVFLCAFLLLVTIAMTGCTSMPKRFTQDETFGEEVGYSIDNRTDTGFTLEVAVMRYSFTANPDKSIQEARETFVKVAQELAKRENRTIEQISKADLQVTLNRNAVDGVYLTYVIGKITYSKNP